MKQAIETSSTRPATPRVATGILFLLTTASCGFPRPPDLAGDDPGGSDGSAGSGLTIHVSPSGDDSNDGFMLPVKTLKHAIGLAIESGKISTIVLATGTYSMSSGETYPYTVPPNVTVVGPAGGGAILMGNRGEPGVTVGIGVLQDLELQDLTTAITVTGSANLKNIRIRNSTIAVQAETTANLTVNNLDITGIAIPGTGACSTGVVLNGGAKLVAMAMTGRGLTPALDAKDQSVVAIANAIISNNATCSGTDISVKSTASFSLSDSLLDGGGGLAIVPQSASFHAIVSNTIIRNMKSSGLVGFPNVKASFQMNGGEISNTEGSGLQLGQGTWTFTNVTIQHNKDLAFYLQDANLNMRNCTVVGNGFGIDVSSGSVADLGTMLNPGNNVFQNNANVGVFAESSVPVNAIGNTWNPNIQGADQNGKYATIATIPGPVASVNNGNFQISDGCSLSR